MYQHAPQPLLDAQRLEQDLPLRRRDVDISGDEIGELAGLVDAGQHLLDHFVGQAGFLAQFGRPDTRLTVKRHERRLVSIEGQHLLGFPHDRLEVAFLVAIVDGDAPPLTVQQQLHAGQPSLKLSDPGDRADGVQDIGGDIFHVLPLRDRKDQPLGVASAASMARRVAGRPAPIGAVTPGNRTTSRRGSTGSVSRSAIRYYSFQIPMCGGGMTGLLRIVGCFALPVPSHPVVRDCLSTTYEIARFPP